MSDEEESSSEGGGISEAFKRQDLIAAVMKKTGLPRGKAGAAVDGVFESITTVLKGGQEVRLVGFGAFMVAERKAAKGRNPRTGEEIDIPYSKSVRFKPGKVLKTAMMDEE